MLKTNDMKNNVKAFCNDDELTKDIPADPIIPPPGQGGKK